MSFVENSCVAWELNPRRYSRRTGYQKISLAIGSWRGGSLASVAAGLRDLAEVFDAMPDAKEDDTRVETLTLMHDGEQGDVLVCFIERHRDRDIPLEELTLPVPKFSLAYEYELSDNPRQPS